MIQLTGVNNFLKKTAEAKKAIAVKATVYVRERAKAVLQEAYRVSPQWSGDFAYNWSIEASATGSRGYTPYGRKGQTGWRTIDRYKPSQMGDPAPGRAAMDEWEKYALGNIKWNSVIRLVNFAPEAEGIGSGELVTRPENAIPGAVSVMAYLQQKFPYLEG